MDRVSMGVSVALALTIFLAESTALAETFEIEESIVINAPQEEVFTFAANPVNDPLWRSEVNEMTADGTWAVGTFYYEDSTLGLNPHYLTVTFMEVLEFPSRMVVQTPHDELFLRAERTALELPSGETLFTYKLQVDTRMPLDATGIFVPTFLARMYYQWVMKSYLRQLKTILESDYS